MTDLSSLYRSLPSVDVLLKSILAHFPNNPLGSVKISKDTVEAGVKDNSFVTLPGGEGITRSLLKELVNSYLDRCRKDIKSGAITDIQDLELNNILPEVLSWIQKKGRSNFKRVLNATGVVIHTNLGRSILAKEAAQAVQRACSHYSNLELNLETGERGSRYSHVEKLICSLTGAEAALVVNNNAAAVSLMLNTLCYNKEVVIARGQLVEIGGSFRIPEVMERSGCTLREVGSTNRVHLKDYNDAINENTGALLRVHTSNYRVVGFHSDVSLEEMVKLGKEKGLPVLDDLGSGFFCDFHKIGLAALAVGEPTVQKVLADGADVVTFSGDKVLGGPQSGIIAGRKDLIERIKKNQLNRAFRVDKMILAALEATLRLYTDPDIAMERIPTLRMISAKKEELKKKAQSLLKKLKANKEMSAGQYISNAMIIDGESRVGGGAFPEHGLPTSLLAIYPNKISATELKERLLSTELPIIGRLESDAFCLDVRTIDITEYSDIITSLLEAFRN